MGRAIPVVVLASLLAPSAWVCAQPAPTPAPTPPPPLAPVCDSPGHHQFDFWVGEWSVYRAGQSEPVAASVIEKLYGGCAVRENWRPAKGTPGGSLNSYRPDTAEWRQLWLDAANELHDYRGRWTGTMIDMRGSAVDAQGVARKVRMTFTPVGDGSVTQTGYRWDNRADDWVLDYMFHYRRDPR